jgi:hypothetical protein
VARVKCNAPGKNNRALPSGMVEILIVPAASEALKTGNRAALRVDQPLIDTVKSYLDRRRLLTTTLRLREPAYIGVQIIAQIVPHQFHNPDTVKEQTLEALHRFISPLPMTAPGKETDQTDLLPEEHRAGWPFGRNLYRAEVYSLIQRVKGVKHALDVQMKIRPVIPGEEIVTPVAPATEEPAPESEEETPHAEDKETEDLSFAADDGLTLIEDRVIEVPPDALLCSLEHQVFIVDL